MQTSITPQMERVLRARALALAQQTEDLSVDDGTEYLVFRIQTQLFAIRGRHTHEVFRFTENQMVRLPGCAEQVSGVLSRRGELLPIVKTSLLLGLGNRAEDQANVVVVSAGSTIFGLQVAEVVGMKILSNAQIIPTVAGASQPWVRGSTPDKITVLRLVPLVANQNLGFKEDSHELRQ